MDGSFLSLDDTSLRKALIGFAIMFITISFIYGFLFSIYLGILYTRMKLEYNPWKLPFFSSNKIIESQIFDEYNNILELEKLAMANKCITKQDTDYLHYLISDKCMIHQHTACVKYFIEKQRTAPLKSALVTASRQDEQDNRSAAATSIVSESSAHCDPADEVRALRASIKEMARKVNTIVGAENKSTRVPTADVPKELIVEVEGEVTGNPLTKFKPEDLPLVKHTPEHSQPNFHGLVGELPDSE